MSDLPSNTPPSGHRLVHIIVFETIAVAILGGLVWGIAWEFGFPRIGLGIAIVIWLTVSPIIEIATVMNYRNNRSS